MQIYVVDILCADSGFFHRQTNRPRWFLATFLQADAMESLASRAVAGYLGQNFRAARAGMFVFFEHEHPGSLGHHKAIAVH